MKVLRSFLFLILLGGIANARTGEVHDDFIIIVVPGAFLLIAWLAYEIRHKFRALRNESELESTDRMEENIRNGSGEFQS